MYKHVTARVKLATAYTIWYICDRVSAAAFFLASAFYRLGRWVLPK